MKKLALGALLSGLMAACGGGGDDPIVLPDTGGGDDSGVPVTCNPIAQTGCLDTEKCTWIVDQEEPQEVGHIGCVPLAGDEIAIDGTCAVGPAGPQGFDNCEKGAICVAAVCKAICDPQMAGVASGCDAQHSCSRYSGLFEVAGSITAGACDPQCDPLNQNLLAGTGNTAACGSVDPAAPNQGCYTFDFETFSCAPANADTLTRIDREMPITDGAGNPFVNGCAPGYMPFFIEGTGSMTTLCTGLCAPAEIDDTDAHKLNGPGDATVSAKLVDKAAPAVGDGLCQAGKKGSAVGGTQNCLFLWPFLLDANGNPGTSPFNETLGVCFSFTQFQFDSDGDMTPDTTFPDCATLPPRSDATTGDADDAADFGCQLIENSQFAPSQKGAPALKNFRLTLGEGKAVAHRFR